MAMYYNEPPLRTERTTVRRLPSRAAYERETVRAILDAALICHLGLVVDGSPRVLPTIHGRDGDTVFVHGSAASRMLRTARGDAEVCLTATIVDGLVLARSAFHHSMNYRSVVVYGRAAALIDPAEKTRALRVISEHVAPGRWEEVRPPSATELKATTVLGLPLVEASAKVRTGAPLDEEDDYDLPVWAGVLPLRMVAGQPTPDPRLAAGIAVSSSIRKRQASTA
ncbi:MAG: pyridoxamine 5'-phosphate oxidase family protein [Acidimicrobiales bacterium]